MPRYVIHFMKNVLGDNGRAADVCQGTLEVDASTEGLATEMAKQRFCKMQALCDWSLHADRIQIEAGDVPA